jgi:hypothetical protein
MIGMHKAGKAGLETSPRLLAGSLNASLRQVSTTAPVLDNVV